MRKSQTTITRHQEDKHSKETSSPFHIEVIAKLEWTQSNAKKHRTITEFYNPSNNQRRINNNRTTTLEQTATQATVFNPFGLRVAKIGNCHTQI